jgi:hypothetical protein
MNRVLKRPMFRIGGSAGTGITSGLDQPRKQYQEGTPNPYATNLMPGTLPGFLTSFGLDLLSRPPSGGLLSTVAQAAKGPFETFQASQLRRQELEGERAFQKELAEKEERAAMERLKTKIESDERIAEAGKELTVNELAASVLGDYQNDLNKATNHARYFLEERPLLAKQYGETQMGGLIEVNLNDPKSIQRAANLKKKDINKIFYELNTGSVLKLIRDQNNKLTFTILDRGQIEDDTGDVLDTTVDQKTVSPIPKSFDFLSEQQRKKLEEIQEGSDKEFGLNFYTE